ncbi:MAG TPA: Asp-tRNA(Asn)/Glu-tRNA(Gln) amidotransferase subunit GatC [Myxococcota bacterium]|jgi:aspartyl-tRNA(Asn)/glutamyl-tRNA(Gln) amidotransferase subunit C
MARISRAELERVALLARISLSDEEADRLEREFDAFLGYIETLQEIDTAGIAPTAHPISLPTPTRPDRPAEAMDPELAVANAPETAASAFLVPKVIDTEAEG